VSSGPEPLIELHQTIKKMLDRILQERKDHPVLGTREIVDLMNIIGKCVVSGNLRRTAEIALGDHDDLEFINLKNYDLNPDRMEFGWVSNNSIYAQIGQDYSQVSDNIMKNGEPGLCWLENMQAYGRMVDPPDHKDKLAAGGNPCLEQTLESYEMCCLVETFPDNHRILAEYKDTLELAFLYAKSVTLGLPS
jgi:ribonucleoside-triphosphate reductase (thioredoxin)